MERIEHIWDTGKTTPHDLDADGIVAFKQETESVGVVGLRWRHNQIVHETPLYATVLPDKSGVATLSPWQGTGSNWMDVINADGTLRFRLLPPPLSDRLDHSHARLEAPRRGWPASGISFGVQAGYKDRLASASFGDGTHVVSVGVFLDIDWATGELKDWKVIPPFA